MNRKVDFLVIGSGIAGLSYALKVADHGQVLIITKANEDESNTKYAQGGIAAVIHTKDSFEKHIEDTLICGDGLCNPEVVRMVITEGYDRVQEMISWGAEFDKKPSGEYDLAKEGGHSEYRVLHHKDNTGVEIERTLLDQIHKHPNISIFTHFYAIDIITQHHLGIEVKKGNKDTACFGVYALNLRTNQIETILCKVAMMATGGAGHIYKTTTNPRIATGDGVAMVIRAKGEVENLEFIQFHPTALYNPLEHPSFLISEAVRGFGAVLRTQNGKSFMQDYDVRESLASRDIVARAIDNEMKISGDEFVYLDCTQLNKEKLMAHFPNIYAKCLSLGINITHDFIPVVPAAHYMCGGIKADVFGRSSINNLYAVGECASTGLHGANRLASNSLLEALVFSHRAALDGIEKVKTLSYREDIPNWDAAGTSEPEELVLITHNLREVQDVMSDYVGIVRSDRRLKRAMDRLWIIFKETESLYEKAVLSPKLCELRNVIKVAYRVIQAAMDRKESIGLHYNTDHNADKTPLKSRN